MAEADNEVLQLTPKGVLMLALHEGDDIERLWRRLRDFVELQARRDGYTDGVPALVFDGGGVCMLAVVVDDKANKAKRRAKA